MAGSGQGSALRALGPLKRAHEMLHPVESGSTTCATWPSRSVGPPQSCCTLGLPQCLSSCGVAWLLVSCGMEAVQP